MTTIQVKPQGNSFVPVDSSHNQKERDTSSEYFLTIKPRKANKNQSNNKEWKKVNTQYFKQRRSHLKWSTDNLSDKELIHSAYQKHDR